ncbi:MAG: hypothetical protein M5R37_10045 [Melioribacteraceae bacterium]|nr:hypothetical protein [Melioribacteraceae bacterium]
MEKKLQELIADFLDEFMFIEYRGNDHIIARKHYGEVFNKIIPKYFKPVSEDHSNKTNVD